MTSHPTIQTRSQSRALEERQEALNAPSTSTAGNELMEEGEFLSFSNCHTPVSTAPADPSTPTPAPHLPNSSGIYSTEDCFVNTIPISDYVHTTWMSSGDSNLPSPGPPSIPLPNSPTPSNNTLTPDPLLLFAQAVQALTRVTSASADHNSSSGKTKVCKPDMFNRTDLCKLHAFLVLCELNFQNRPKAFATDCTTVTYVQSYLRGMALKWFEPDLLNVSNPNAHPIWMDNYHQFISELKSNFGLHDPVGDAEHQLDNLSMKEGQKINKYVIEFNCLTGQVCGYGDGALHHIFYSSLPNRIKDEISHIGKPHTLDGYHTLAQTLDARYWERKSKILCQTKNSSLLPTSNSKSSTSSSDSKGKSKEKDNKSKGSNNKSKGSSSSSGASKSATPDAPSHLGKDGKLTEEECQRHIKDKLCMFCGHPGHMAKDCPKSTSKSTKTKARVAKVKTPAAAESKK